MDKFPAASRRFWMALNCEEKRVPSVTVKLFTRCKRASERRVQTRRPAGPGQLHRTPGSGPVSWPPGPDAAGGPPSESWTDCWCPEGEEGGTQREGETGVITGKRLLQNKKWKRSLGNMRLFATSLSYCCYASHPIFAHIHLTILMMADVPSKFFVIFYTTGEKQLPVLASWSDNCC